MSDKDKKRETIEMRCPSVGVGWYATKGFIDAPSAKAARIPPEDIDRNHV